MPRQKAAVSIRDVAAAAGVSVATVSRVLSSDAEAGLVRPQTRTRVQSAIDELGYRPNDLARALLHQRTSTVGLVLPDIANPYYPPLVRAVEDGAVERGHRVVLCNTDRSPEKFQAYLDVLVKSRVDGIIIAGATTDLPADAVMRTYKTQIVAVGPHDGYHCSVGVDNRRAQRSATNHALELGHRRIGYVRGPAGSRTADDRLAGHREALAAAGLETDNAELILEGGFDEHAGFEAVGELVARRPRPTAIACANDRVAFGAYAALADAGLRIPEDVTVIGFDDITTAEFLRPTLTTVSVPTYDIGRHAIAMLLDAIDGVRPASSELVSTRLVVRDSSATPPA